MMRIVLFQKLHLLTIYSCTFCTVSSLCHTTVKPSIGTQTSLDSSSVVEIIAGCAVGVVVCIIIMALLILLMWCQRLRRIKNKGTQGSYLAYRVRRCS